MIAKITTGRSFRGAFLYYFSDKERKSSKRVEWSQCRNVFSRNHSEAWRAMSYTALSQDRIKEAAGRSRVGRKLEKPVFCFSLSWHPSESPSKKQMLKTAENGLKQLGLEHHESVIVSHRDTPHKHVHIVVNRVHPLEGLAADVKNSKRKISEFCLRYERENGIFCKQREANDMSRQKEKDTRYCDPVIDEAWRKSADITEFCHYLESNNYYLCRGRRLVVLDARGKVMNPVRHLEKVTSQEFSNFAGDSSRLPTIERAKAIIEEKKLEANNIKATLHHELQVGNERIEHIRKCHAEEFRAANIHYKFALRSSEERLEKFYELNEKRENIAHLNERLQKLSFFERILGKRKTVKEQVERAIEALDNALKSINMHKEELRRKHAENLDIMAERHRREISDLRTWIEKLRSNERTRHSSARRLIIKHHEKGKERGYRGC